VTTTKRRPIAAFVSKKALLIFARSSVRAMRCSNRSEERRVGKECRYRWAQEPYKKKHETYEEETR